MAEPVVERAPAKINPYLRVLGRRRDGFHEIETILLPIDLADSVTVEVRDDGRFPFRVTGPRAGGVPTGPENLVLRAARGFAAATGVRTGATIVLRKHIPVAAGLGGGSSDAAATLRALDRAWRTDIDETVLLRVAASVGSDVPGMVLGGPVVASGRGEVVRRIESPPTSWSLATLDAGIRASDAYRWWDRGVRRRFHRPPSLAEALRALTTGDPGTISTVLYNSLEPGVLRRHPSVVAARLALLEGGRPNRSYLSLEGHRWGALGALVSGSGPTVAGLCRDEQDARRLALAVGGVSVRTEG